MNQTPTLVPISLLFAQIRDIGYALDQQRWDDAKVLVNEHDTAVRNIALQLRHYPDPKQVEQAFTDILSLGRDLILRMDQEKASSAAALANLHRGKINTARYLDVA